MSSSMAIPETEDLPRCTVCGARLPAGGSCSLCLLKLAEMDAGGDDEVVLESLRQHGFGDYVVLSEIARGGMGVVYRARQISLERDVALKMILAGELAGRKALRMFQTEAQAAANLHHPNIIPVYEIGEHEMQNYFTMRFIPGGQTIAHWAVSQRHSPKTLATAAAKVARAVAHAHDRGVLHRDLKPSNVLWDPAGEPMVTDFGLAKLLDKAPGSTTFSGNIIGSPSYMAPEQADAKAGTVTTATDVYGIGALLYEMLSGRPPFIGSTPLDTLRKVSQDLPAALPDVPKDLRTICLKCLSKRSEDRYASAALLADDLERFIRGEPVTAVPLSVPQTFWRWILRKPRHAAVLGLLFFSFFFGVTGIIWQWRAAERANAAQAETLSRLRWQEIERWVRDGESSRALAYLAALIRERPDNWQAAMYAMSIVDQNSLAVLAGPEIRPPVRSIVPAGIGPDGTWVLTAGEDNLVRLWDTVTGMEIRRLPVTGIVKDIATSLDSSFALALSSGSIQFFPPASSEGRSVSRKTDTPVLDLQFSADGNRLLSRTAQTVELWPVAALDAEPVILTLTNNEKLRGAALSADGSHLLAWGKDTAAVWEVSTQRKMVSMEADANFTAGALSAGGCCAALIDGAFVARSWDVKSATPRRTIESPLAVLSLITLSGDGTRITLAGKSNDLVVYDTMSGLQISENKAHRYEMKHLMTDARGERVFSFSMDSRVNVWDATTGKSVMGAIWVGKVEDLDRTSAIPSHDGRLVLVHKLGHEETLNVWQGTLTKQPIHYEVAGQRDSNSGTLSPDGRLGTLGLNPGDRSYIFELDTGRVLLDEKVAGDVYVTLFSPDMKCCYSLTANGWLYGWSLETGQELWPPNHQSGRVRPAAISQDGTRILAGHNDGHIRIYDTATGKVIHELKHPGEVKTLRFAPDNSGRFISGSADRLAHLWDVHTGRKLHTLTGHQHTVLASAWSPDSQWVATASYDSTVRIWNAQTGLPVGAPLEHYAWLSHLEYSPDGKLLATACRDGTARLWHAPTGKPASPPLRHDSTCQTVRFTADGKAFIVRDHSGFCFWDTERAERISIHYDEPLANGLGMDSPPYRAVMTSDGTRVYLGSCMNYGALYSIEQPREPSPSWFADFIELLAAMRQDNAISTARHTHGQLHHIRKQMEESQSQGPHALWAQEILTQAGQ